MGLSFDEAKEVQNQFIEEYADKNPYEEYINGVGISKVYLKKDERNYTGSLDDLCLIVNLLKELPTHLTLPKTYQGMHVFYQVIGEIRAL